MIVRISRDEFLGIRMIAGGMAAWLIASLIVMTNTPENTAAIATAYVIITAGAAAMAGGFWRQNMRKLSIVAGMLFLGLVLLPVIYVAVTSTTT